MIYCTGRVLIGENLREIMPKSRTSMSISRNYSMVPSVGGLVGSKVPK